MKLKKSYELNSDVSFANDDYPPDDFVTKRMNNAEAVQKLIDLATKYNTVYVNGTVGQELTEALINSTINFSSGNKARAERNKNRVPYDYYAFDCSGMVKALFLWEWEGDNYVYNGNEDINESGLWKLCAEDGNSTKFTSYDSILPGEFLYIENKHCGIYIGAAMQWNVRLIGTAGHKSQG